MSPEESQSHISSRTDESVSDSTTDAQADAETTEAEPRPTTDECPDCETALKHIDGELCCPDCGYISESDQLDRRVQYQDRTDSSVKRERNGPPVSSNQTSADLLTNISYNNKDAHGNLVTADKRRRLYRLRKAQRHTRAGKKQEQTLRSGFIEIKRMGTALGLPSSVLQTARSIFRRAHQDGHIQGRAIESVATAALVLASKIEQSPRPFSKFAPVSRVDSDRIRRAQWHLNNELSLPVETTHAEEYLPQFYSELRAPASHTDTAQDLINEYYAQELASGKAPTGIAAGAIYAASVKHGELILQRSVASVAGCAERTVRKRYREILAADPDTHLTKQDINEREPRAIASELNDGNVCKLTPATDKTTQHTPA